MGKIIVADDVTDAMKAEVIAAQVIAEARPQYNLRQLCREINFGSKILGKFPIQTNLAGQEKVPELEEADLAALSFVDINFDLWKNVVHVAMSKESQLRSDYDILQMSVTDAARDLARMENKQIAAELDSATAIAGTLWDNDANSPMKDILAGQTALNDLGYNPGFLSMPPAVYEAFASNAKVVDAYVRGATVRGNIPNVLGLDIIIDPALTAKTGWIVDKNAPAFALADGPTMVAKYPGGPKFYEGWAIAQFLEPKQVLAGGSRKLTGLIA